MSKIIFSVSELNKATQKLLEGHFGQITVEGEISNLSRPTSGHLYFSLKDQNAQVRCAMFRMQSKRLNFEPRNGLLVEVDAKVSLYPDRGDYQLIIESMEMAGDGLLRQAYEKLVKKLAEEGLFQEKYKKALPHFPKHIGVITSPTGAAVRDILSVLKRRFPLLPVSIYPTKVQGMDAAPEIVKAIEMANRYPNADVIIVARGGGSLEDLWPFNEEIVARAIFLSQIPIISGVGHETDFTIADLVADKRAPTPSAAAELVSPNATAFLNQLQIWDEQLKNNMFHYLQIRGQRLDNLMKRLRHPGQVIKLQQQRFNQWMLRLRQSILQTLKDKRNSLTSSMRALDTISPLSTIERGYAIVTKGETGEILRSVKKIEKGDKVQVKISDGNLNCEVI